MSGTAGTLDTTGSAGSSGSTSIAGTSSGGSNGTAGKGGAGGGSGGTAGSHPGLAGGEKCTESGACASGACLDGVCCTAACAGKCMSCAGSITGQADGTCAGVQAGTDPHDDCTKGTDTCGLDGMCDGAGACRSAPPSTTCGTEMCAANQYTAAAQCDGTGRCVTPTPSSCEGNPCVGTRCDIKCAMPTDCPTGLYCAGTVCASLKTNGTKCAANAECSSAHCVEGVCCGDVCTAKCNSCLQTNTGKTDGTCAPVKAGQAHGTDCPGSATCPAGGSTYTPAPTCDGSGACAATPASCGNYLCNSAAASCTTACTSNTQCIAADYCSGSACVPKLAPGTLCTASAQCTSNTCSGRCCASGKACTCPQPSAGNLIKNPGFDTNLSGWTIDAGAATINWQPGTLLDGNGAYADANACPYSGSAYISEPDGNDSQNIWQCISLALNTSYNFGAQIATLSGAYAYCDVDAYQGPGCTGNHLNLAEFNWLNTGWSPADLSAQFNSSFYLSAKVYCHVQQGGSFYFDDIFVTPASPAPGLY